MTVLKDDNGKTPLIRSVGLREYVHYDRPFGVAIGPVSEARRTDLADALERLRALGIAESLVQPMAPPTWQGVLPAGFVLLTASPAAGGPPQTDATPTDAAEACVLDDLGTAPRFERLSVYRPTERGFIPRLGADRRRHIVVLPLRQRRHTLNGRILERRDRGGAITGTGGAAT